MGTYAVQAEGLVKRFGKATALAGIDLAVRSGEVHGFLVPNGAGKTTTIRIMLGLLRADAGSIRLLGGDPWRDVTDLHRRLAYVPGDVSLWPTLNGGETRPGGPRRLTSQPTRKQAAGHASADRL
jgi:ABC-2 type transport system ATP-binding protein